MGKVWANLFNYCHFNLASKQTLSDFQGWDRGEGCGENYGYLRENWWEKVRVLGEYMVPMYTKPPMFFFKTKLLYNQGKSVRLYVQ